MPATKGRIKFNETGTKIYEAGVSRGVLYPTNDTEGYDAGVNWSGLINVNESPEGGEANDAYADDGLYLSMQSAETFGFTIEAFTYPLEFGKCDGTAELAPGIEIGQQDRTPFGFSYVTKVGNDVKKLSYGRKIHLVYGGMAAPSEKERGTINDSPEAVTFSWECKSTPITMADGTATSKLTIDTTKVSAEIVKKIEDLLYGTETTTPTLPTPDQVIALVKGE